MRPAARAKRQVASSLDYRTPREVRQTWDDAEGSPQKPAA
jgi:hypothetical protein